MEITLTEYTVNKVIDSLKGYANMVDITIAHAPTQEIRIEGLGLHGKIRGLYQFLEKEIKRQNDPTPTDPA